MEYLVRDIAAFRSRGVPQFFATLLTLSFLRECEYSRVFEGPAVSLWLHGY